MSLKTAGAPSTNPPAVIGRAWASLMAACAAPVLMPVCCLLGGFSRSSCAKTTFKSKTEDKVRLSAPARAREGAIVWQETNSSSNGLSTRRKSSHTQCGPSILRLTAGVIKSASQFMLPPVRCPVIFPFSVRSHHPKSEHLAEVVSLPPCSCDLHPVLDEIAVGTLNLARTDGQIRSERSLVVQAIRPVGDIAEAGTNRSLLVRDVGRFQKWPQCFENILPAILFQPVLLLFHPGLFLFPGDPFSCRRQVFAKMTEIDQIMRLAAKLFIHLLGDPHRSIAHTMELRLVSRSRFQGAHQKPPSCFLHAAHRRSKDGSHRTPFMGQA